ncbi:MAG: glycosyltransferase [Oscillospiraceae bacterium]|nr:glycosyltransferase [Oscillospiraceae bacterium]
MKRKVLVVLPEMQTGGGQRMAVEIAAHIRDENLRIKIISLYPPQGTVVEALAEGYGLDVCHLKKHKGIDFGVVLRLYKAIKAFQPDVIHAHLRVMPYLLLPMCMTGVRLRYYTAHSLAEKDANGIKQVIMRFAFRHCHVQPVAISPMCRRSLTQTYGIPAERIPCIYNGIDIKRFAGANECTDHTPFRFSAIGRLSAEKNYTMMLGAFSSIHQLFPHSELVIMGDGELREAIMHQCDELKIRDAVRFTGNVPDVEKYLWRSDAYLMSSDYEGLPLTVLEAMAAGLPIISTKAGGVVDVVEHEKNGLLVDCGDQEGLIHAMKRLIQSPELCRQFSTHSAELAKKYSIQACAEQYKALYLQ